MTEAVTARGTLVDGGELGALMRAIDWAATPFGPEQAWPSSLRTLVRLMLQTRLGMYIAWGPDWRQLYNDAFRPILGKSKHPALGKPARETFGESWDEIEPIFNRVLAGESLGADDWLLPLDRHGYLEECHFSFSCSPILDDDGRVGGVVVTIDESTQRVMSERRARTFQSLCARALAPETSADVWSAASAALADNRWDFPFALLYELEPARDYARLVGSSEISDGHLLAPRTINLSVADAVWPFAQVLASGEHVHVRGSVPVDGAPWPAGAWLAPAREAMVLPIGRPGLARPYGFLVAGLSSGRALDELHTEFLLMLARHIGSALSHARAYDEERRRGEALVRLDHAKTLFFRNVSHEFRTPLTLILGPTEDLASGLHGPLTAAQSRQLGIVHRNAQRLLRLVNNLLELARIESGRAQALYEPLELGQLTAEIASAFRPATERAGLRFVVEPVEPDDPVYVDRDIWEKILLNLLSNAFKFTFAGEIRVRVATDEPGHVTLEVEDTGVGIPKSEQSGIFERFPQGQRLLGRDDDGSGVGLAVVRELARLHGGIVSVASEPGRGSRFSVRLQTGSAAERTSGVTRLTPVRSHNASVFVEEALRSLQVPPVSPSAHPAWIEPNEPVTAETAGARVLIVDDNADMREYLRRLLSTRYYVELASDGALALDAARHAPPDLVITDAMLPNLDGFGLLRELRADPRTADVAVMMLSASASEESRIEGLSQGANDYLSKPFSARELIARANSQIALRRVRQAADSNRVALYELFMQAPAPICVLRGRGLVFEMANTSFLRAIGRNEVLGKSLLEAVPELRGQGLDDLLRDVLLTGKPYYGQEISVHLAGSSPTPEQRNFSFVFSALRPPDGKTERVMLFATEVTDEVRARNDLDEARRRAEGASRAKDEFLAMLGHELRNPLAPITTALELMHQQGSPMFQKERTIIGHQVQHLIRLVDDLLDVSRVTRAKLQLRKHPVEISEVVSRAIELASPLLEERHHRLTTRVPSSGLLVLGDEMRLAQVVSNLLTNAAKYTGAGGDIAIDAEASGAEVVLRVRDTGMGISPELAPRIFDLFVQGARPQAGAAGLGLGLTLVRSLTQLHGGSVAMRSEGPGHGSEFELRFPLLDARTVVPERSERPSTLPPMGAPRVKRRVLIVDDNEDAAELLAEGLRRCGHEVRVAFEAPGGIDLARDFKPHVALLDLGLPVMDGYELARALHQLPEAASTQLIAVTGYGQDNDRKRSREAGFARHLVKPVDLASIDQNIRQLVADETQAP